MKINSFFDNIIYLSSLLFLIKWFFFFNSDFEINLLTRFIFEVKDWQYFTYIYNLSNLNFNPTYDPNLINLKFIPLPIYSTVYHSIFLKIFNIYGFILIEFLIILSFFYILINFFKIIGIGKIESIFLTLFLFCIPNLIEYFQLNEIKYLSKISELYNLRIPRPSITHLYLFSFFLLLILNKKNNQFKYSQLIWMGLIFALMWGSFYYNLIISGIIFIIYYFYVTYKSNQFFFKYIKDVFIVLVSFIFFSLPIIFILFNSEPDWLIRVGLVELDIPNKKILLIHFLERILSFNFIIIFIFISILYLFLISKKIYKTEGINLLYFIFFGSFLAPLIFVIFSPTISEVYHFSNMIISLSFFVILIFSYLIILYYTRNFSWYRNMFKTSIIFLLIFYTFSNYSLTKQNPLKIAEINFDQLINDIKKNNINKESQILTFDGKLQTYLILNGFKNLTNPTAIYTSLNDEMVEEKLINTFKFLNLNQIDFNNFIKNEKQGWRFIGKNLGKTFYLKYQANSLTTYKGSMDFTSEELKYILNSSPLHSQQLIIPAFEIKRLVKKFNNFSDIERIRPDLIVTSSDDSFIKNIKIDDYFYCSNKINEIYTIYYSKKIKSKC